MSLSFEWDRSKAEANEKKHGISFEEASTAFGDTLSLTIPDPIHSHGEERYVLIGHTFRGNLVVVAHVEKPDAVIRIISARVATRGERRTYEEA